ncbi:MAG: hypothetical protein ACR2NW_05245 [Thermodesulfobacteriota bacterium]
MSDKIGKAKGSVYLFSREFIINNHGDDLWNKILEPLNHEEKEFCNSQMSLHEWYPVYLLNKVFDSFDNIVGSNDKKSIIPIAEYIAQKDLSPVFNLFVNLKDPVFVLQNIPSIWNRYFDTGKVVINLSDSENKHYQFALEDGIDENRFSGQAICKYGTVTWINTALKIVGADNVSIDHQKCRYDNEPVCITDVKWD